MEKKQLHEALFDPSLYPPLWQPYVIFWGSVASNDGHAVQCGDGCLADRRDGLQASFPRFTTVTQTIYRLHARAEAIFCVC